MRSQKSNRAYFFDSEAEKVRGQKSNRSYFSYKVDRKVRGQIPIRAYFILWQEPQVRNAHTLFLGGATSLQPAYFSFYLGAKSEAGKAPNKKTIALTFISGRSHKSESPILSFLAGSHKVDRPYFPSQVGPTSNKPHTFFPAGTHKVQTPVLPPNERPSPKKRSRGGMIGWSCGGRLINVWEL